MTDTKDKVLIIKNKLDELDNSTIDKVYSLCNNVPINKKENKIIKVRDVDTKSNKYKISLEFVNKILENIGKSHIDDLTKFVNIDREDIIKEVNKQTFLSMEDKLFEVFDKTKCGWYRRNSTKNYILTFMRYMCNYLDLEFTTSQKDITERIGNKNYRKTHVYYSIK